MNVSNDTTIMQQPVGPVQGALQSVRNQERSGGISVRELTDPRARLAAGMHIKLPRTPGGHLAAMLRMDLLPPEEITEASIVPQDAYTMINHDEGFPALPDGRPLWFKLDCEPEDLFAAFGVYVDLIDSGPRHIAQLLESTELKSLMNGSLTMDTLRNAYYMYYWKDRALAHDMFQDAAYRHIRVRRALSTEDKSHVLASKMLAKLETIFEKSNFWDIIENDPAVALQYLEKLTRIQRISAGLPAAAPGGEVSEEGSSFEMIMRRVQENNSPVAEAGSNVLIDESGRLVSDNKGFMQGALHDPKTSKMMQEVIIRMTQGAGATKTPRWAARVAKDEDEEVSPQSVPVEFRGLIDPSLGIEDA